MPSAARSGTRSIIFNGIATAAALEQTIDLVFKTDGRAPVLLQALQSYFEIDSP